MSSGVGSIFAGALMVVIPALVALVAFGPAPRSRDTPKVILVTGASSGLGKLMLDELRKAFPASVVYGTSRSGWSAKGTRVTKGDSPLGVTEEDGTQPLLALDVTDEDSVKRCVDAIVASLEDPAPFLRVPVGADAERILHVRDGLGADAWSLLAAERNGLPAIVPPYGRGSGEAGGSQRKAK